MTGIPKTSIPRLRSVTDKATGRRIDVITPRGNIDRQRIEEALASAIANHDGRLLSGYAIVVWAMDGSTTCSLFAGSMPRAVVPQMVKDRLLLETAKKWIAPLDEPPGGKVA